MQNKAHASAKGNELPKPNLPARLASGCSKATPGIATYCTHFGIALWRMTRTTDIATCRKKNTTTALGNRFMFVTQAVP